jgi:hypothetical protein
VLDVPAVLLVPAVCPGNVVIGCGSSEHATSAPDTNAPKVMSLMLEEIRVLATVDSSEAHLVASPPSRSRVLKKLCA